MILTTSSLELWMLSEASRLLLKLKSTDEYCYILFSAFNKIAEEPTSFDEVLANLYYELYKTEQDEEKEKIQMAIGAVKTIYDQYEDELESAISTNKMDARISDKFNDNRDPTVFYRFLSEELECLKKSKTPETRPTLNKERPTSLHR